MVASATAPLCWRVLSPCPCFRFCVLVTPRLLFLFLVVFGLGVTFPSWCFVVSLQPRPFSLLNLEQKPSSFETLMFALLPAVLPLPASGTTAPGTVLPLYRGGLGPKGYGEVLPIPHSVSSSLSLAARAPSAAPSSVCRLRAVPPCSSPVGSIPTLPHVPWTSVMPRSPSLLRSSP